MFGRSFFFKSSAAILDSEKVMGVQSPQIHDMPLAVLVQGFTKQSYLLDPCFANLATA